MDFVFPRMNCIWDYRNQPRLQCIKCRFYTNAILSLYLVTGSLIWATHYDLLQSFTFHLLVDDKIVFALVACYRISRYFIGFELSRSPVSGSSEHFSSYFLQSVHFMRFNCTFYQIYWHKWLKVSTDKISYRTSTR